MCTSLKISIVLNGFCIWLTDNVKIYYNDNAAGPKQRTSWSVRKIQLSMNCYLNFKNIISCFVNQLWPIISPLDVSWLNHQSILLLIPVVIFTHLVQAHKCVESFSCRHRHLCVVFLQDQHVKHQLGAQMKRVGKDKIIFKSQWTKTSVFWEHWFCFSAAVALIFSSFHLLLFSFHSSCQKTKKQFNSLANEFFAES